MKNLENFKKWKSLIAGLAIFSVVAISGIVAYFTDIKTITSKATMGKVSIEAAEETVSGGSEENTNVIPGDIISKTPKVTAATGTQDCYVRAKVALELQENGDKYIQHIGDPTIRLTSEDIVGLNTDWVSANDGYYYLKTKLQSGDTSTLFTGVKIPKTVDSSWAKDEVQIVVTFEAIQAAHVTPNFETLDGNGPWGTLGNTPISESTLNP